MTFQFDGYNYLIRLEKGEQLVESLLAFASEHNLPGAWVSGIGGALSAELGFYDLTTQQYRWKKFDQLMEITSLQGNLAWDEDKPIVHLHGALSDSNMQTYSGHIKELEVGGTCELFIHVWNKDQIKRTQDPDTGLKLLNL